MYADAARSFKPNTGASREGGGFAPEKGKSYEMGIKWEALDRQLMLVQQPGVFCCGEMLDWDAPTGGYLLTACLSSGHWAGQGVKAFLDTTPL